MKHLRDILVKTILLLLLFWGLLVMQGVGDSFSGSKSGCVTCHTDLGMLKKNLSEKENKESAMTAGMG